MAARVPTDGNQSGLSGSTTTFASLAARFNDADAFWAELTLFYQNNGLLGADGYPDPRKPTVKWDVDIPGKKANGHEFFVEVIQHEGFDSISNGDLKNKDQYSWWDVVENLGLATKSAGTWSFNVKAAYAKFLLPFELHLTGRTPQPRPPFPLNANAALAYFNARRARQGRPLLANSVDEVMRRVMTEQEYNIMQNRLTRSATNAAGAAGTGAGIGHTLSAELQQFAHPNFNPQTQTIDPTFNVDQSDDRHPRSVMNTIPHATPSNRRDLFAQTGSAALAAAAAALAGTNTTSDQTEQSEGSNAGAGAGAGSGYIPPTKFNIYDHILRALNSPVPSEIEYALHHYVIISDERGDKLKFADFYRLFEGLRDQFLKAASLFTGVDWVFDDGGNDLGSHFRFLDPSRVTPDLLDRLRQCGKSPWHDDDLQDEATARQLRLTREAGLTLRNMSMLEENVLWIAEEDSLRDTLTLILNLPPRGCFNELINDALDIAEQVCPYWTTSPSDHLMLTLQKFLLSRDRYHIITALKAISVFSMETRTPKVLVNIPLDIIRTLLNYTYLDQDKALLSGVLDFLYQFSVLPENVETLLHKFRLHLHLVPRLVNLLLYDSDRDDVVKVIREEKREPPTQDIPRTPDSLLRQLMAFPEPERCSRWLKCCFIEDPPCEITQLALWHAYQDCFSNNPLAAAGNTADGQPQVQNQPVQGTSTLSASDFINTVSRTFASAQAQVVQGPPTKFIIKGIRPLETAYNMDGYPFLHCKWRVSAASGAAPVGSSMSTSTCSQIFIDPAKLRDHVWADHLLIPRTQSSPSPDETAGTDSPKPSPSPSFDLSDSPLPNKACFWSTCTAHLTPSSATAFIAGHVATHLPPIRSLGTVTDSAKPPPPTPPPRRITQSRITRVFDYYRTQTDEKGEPVGVAYKAALILRNIARNLPKGGVKAGAGLPRFGDREGEREEEEGKVAVEWKQIVFETQKRKVLELAEANPSLRGVLLELMADVDL